MKIVLDKWQQEVLEYQGSFLLCTGRQNGKTTIMSIKIGNYMMDNPGARIIVVSLTEDQAKLMIVMTLDYLEKVDKKQIAKGKNKPTQNKIMLTNKSSVIARPVGNTGDAIRGFTGDVLVIDECSRMPELAIEAGRPTLFSTGGQIWMCSTPFGKKGYFWECFQNKDNRFRVWHVNSEDIAYNREISEGWTQKQREGAIRHLEEERTSKSKNYYGQEYLALFLDDLRRFFEDEIILPLMTRKKERVHDASYFLGVDIARMGDDETTYEIIAKKDGRYYHVESMVRKKQYTTQTQQDILDLDYIFQFDKIGIDAGSGALGVGVFDNLRQTHIRNKLVAMNNRSLVIDRDGHKQRMQKEDYYDNLKAMMERKEIELLDDESVKLSLQSVQFDISNEEDSTSKVKIFGNYTHIAEGLIRAAWLAKEAKDLNSFKIHYV